MIPLSAVPIQNPAVFSKVLGAEEIVLINGDNAASLALTNQTAILIWKLVDGQNSVRSFINEIQKKFHQVPDSVEEDILALLEKLSQGGFIGFEWKPDQAF